MSTLRPGRTAASIGWWSAMPRSAMCWRCSRRPTTSISLRPTTSTPSSRSRSATSTLEEALTAILSVANYTWVEKNGIILITSMSDGVQLPADIQGRQTQVFELDFASASTLSEAVTGFLSPIGKLAVTTSDPSDNRRTREMIVVEDLPEAMDRIADYIAQVDQPPRQVLIEAHILQVTLKDNEQKRREFCRSLSRRNVNIISVPSQPRCRFRNRVC